MPEPDVEKKRKKRRRSARVYLSNAHPLPTPEQLAALVDQFPSDEDDDQADAVAQPDRVKRDYSQSQRRRLAREGKALPSGAYPIADTEDLHNAAVLARSGHGDVEAARKLIARRARELGVKNPLEATEKAMFNHPDPYSGAHYADARTSAPITEGHASPSTGDHGVGQGRGSHLAAHHPDLRQSNTSFDQVLATLRTVRGDRTAAEIGLAGFAQAGEVTVRQFDAAGQAGHYHDMQAVNPSPLRPGCGIARNSATPPDGGHSTASPSRPPTGAMKASEAREVLRRHLFPGSGAR